MANYDEALDNYSEIRKEYYELVSKYKSLNTKAYSVGLIRKSLLDLVDNLSLSVKQIDLALECLDKWTEKNVKEVYDYLVERKNTINKLIHSANMSAEYMSGKIDFFNESLSYTHTKLVDFTSEYKEVTEEFFKEASQYEG